jgi:ABC-2 type transport system permease protein
VVVELILITVAMLIGIVMQTFFGYYHYEFLQYFKELYLVTFPQILIFILLALFVQTVVSNKFVGYAILIGVFVIVPILVQLWLGEYSLPHSQPTSIHLL